MHRRRHAVDFSRVQFSESVRRGWEASADGFVDGPSDDRVPDVIGVDAIRLAVRIHAGWHVRLGATGRRTERRVAVGDLHHRIEQRLHGTVGRVDGRHFIVGRRMT